VRSRKSRNSSSSNLRKSVFKEDQEGFESPIKHKGIDKLIQNINGSPDSYVGVDNFSNNVEAIYEST
jgi:hypothetical protein